MIIDIGTLDVKCGAELVERDKGYLSGGIGEVMEAYYYGIELYRASVAAHDGEIERKKVQI